MSRYYLDFTSALSLAGARGQTPAPILPDGKALYEVEDFSFSIGNSTPGRNIAGGSGFGLGSFTLPSSNLATWLDLNALNNVPLRVDLYAFNDNRNSEGYGSTIIHDAFKDSFAINSAVDIGTGETEVDLRFFGYVESSTSVLANGRAGPTSTAGYSFQRNMSDNSFTVDAGGAFSPNPAITNSISTGLLNQPATAAPSRDLFIQIRDSTGVLISNNQTGWVKIEDADFSTARDIIRAPSGTSQAELSRPVLEPLHVSFQPGTIEPALSQAIASGRQLQIEIAAYSPLFPTDANKFLVDDYRFGKAFGIESERVILNGVPTVNFSFEYDRRDIGHFGRGGLTATAQSSYDEALTLPSNPAVRQQAPAQIFGTLEGTSTATAESFQLSGNATLLERSQSLAVASPVVPSVSVPAISISQDDAQADADLLGTAAAIVGPTMVHGFDAEFYRLTNSDVARAGVNLLEHYQQHGFQEGRDPNAFFDVSEYLAANLDVAAAGIDPMRHYLDVGFAEGRSAGPAFNATDYLATYADVAASGMNALEHFLQFGFREGRDPTPDAIA